MWLFYNIIDLVQMRHIILNDNNSSIVTQSKNFQNSKNEDKYEYDHRQYRFLISVFANNINQFIKSSKDCLAELEFQPKYRVNNEVQDFYEPLLADVFQKYKQRITKETTNRNTMIKKSCQTYLNQYQQAFPAPTTPNTTLSSFSIIKKVRHTGKDSLMKSFKSQTRKTASAESTQDKSQIIYQTLKTFQTQIPNAIQFKTASSSDKPSREYFFKSRSAVTRNERRRVKSDSLAAKPRISSISKNSKNQSRQDRMPNQNQIEVIDSRRGYNCSQEWQCDKQVATHNKFCTKRVVAIGQSQKKAIHDIELLHLQTNNVCISKAFQTLPDQTFTYKPKVKNWLVKEYN